jgi:hypothetical protein
MENEARGLINALCARGYYDAAREVVEALEDLVTAKVFTGLLDAVVASERSIEMKVCAAALKMFDVDHEGKVPAGLNLTPADVKSAQQEGWVVVSDTGLDLFEVASPTGEWVATYSRAGAWVLCRRSDPESTSSAMLQVMTFTTLRAAIAWALQEG